MPGRVVGMQDSLLGCPIQGADRGSYLIARNLKVAAGEAGDGALDGGLGGALHRPVAQASLKGLTVGLGSRSSSQISSLGLVAEPSYRAPGTFVQQNEVGMAQVLGWG